MNPLQAASAALTGAANAGVPGAGTSPNATGANAFVQAAIGHLQGLAKSGFQLQQTGAPMAGIDAQSKIDENNRQNAIQAQIDAEKQKQSDLAETVKELKDPSKYYRQQNKSGGWDFYAPDGTKITPQQYAQVKGQHVTDALKGSQNTTDQEFLQDYQDVQKLGEVMQSGDKAGLQKLYKQDPTLKARIGNQTYAQIVKGFRDSYPQYFPQNTTQDVGNASYNNTSPNKLAGGGSLWDKIKGIF